MALDLDLAAGRMEQARQHLERRGLAGAVRAEEADPLAALDREADAVDRLDHLVRAMDQRLSAAANPGGRLCTLKCFVEVARADHVASSGSSLARRCASSPTVLIGSESTASPSSIGLEQVRADLRRAGSSPAIRSAISCVARVVAGLELGAGAPRTPRARCGSSAARARGTRATPSSRCWSRPRSARGARRRPTSS